jgi:hypothetical protein
MKKLLNVSRNIPSLTMMARQGFWWCKYCESVSAPDDETCGEGFMSRCERCRRRGFLEWRPAVLPESNLP